MESVRRVCSPVATRNIVVPYISMRSPTSWAPTLTASVQASIVPVMTGVPSGRPVRAAAAVVTVPAISPAQRSGGCSTVPANRCHQGSCHRSPSMSYNGETWLADWWSRT